MNRAITKQYDRRAACTRNKKPCRYLDAYGSCCYGLITGHSKLRLRNEGKVTDISPPTCQLYAPAERGHKIKTYVDGVIAPERMESHEPETQNRAGVQGRRPAPAPGRPAGCPPAHHESERPEAPRAGAAPAEGHCPLPAGTADQDAVRQAKRKEAQARYYQKNKERLLESRREYQRKYAAEHREEIRRNLKRFRERNKADLGMQQRALLLQIYRAHYGLTQMDLAEKVGVSKAVIVNYENLITKIPDSALLKLGIKP